MHEHPWVKRLLTPLPDAQLCAGVAVDDPLWEKVETELLKLGTLSCGQVDINAVAENCLILLETRTKDMRVLAQLLRCLQHSAQISSFATALILLESWLENYWLVAWPASLEQKQKVLIQILRRFENTLPRTLENVSHSDLEQLQPLAQKLAARWHQTASDKAALTDDLVNGIRRALQRQQTERWSDPAVAPTPTVIDSDSAPTPVEINTTDDRSWRQTQLSVAAYLVERQPDSPVGYRLRRNAIWSGITTAPVGSHNNQTQLTAVSPDRVKEYHRALMLADHMLWTRIEQSLVLAPYWFEGHFLSASVASSLGYPAVATAIAEELSAFLQRLPDLETLAFNDGTLFLPDNCRQWLQRYQPVSGDMSQAHLASEVAICCKEKGLNAALLLLEEHLCRLKEPRDYFYAQWVLADLLMKEGMEALARQHYQHLWQESQRLGLMQWEPGSVSRVERLATSRKN